MNPRTKSRCETKDYYVFRKLFQRLSFDITVGSHRLNRKNTRLWDWKWDNAKMLPSKNQRERSLGELSTNGTTFLNFYLSVYHFYALIRIGIKWRTKSASNISNNLPCKTQSYQFIVAVGLDIGYRATKILTKNYNCEISSSIWKFSNSNDARHIRQKCTIC